MSSRFRFNSALRAAWVIYVVLLLVPLAVFGVVMVLSASRASSEPSHGVNRWFLGTTAYLIVAVPAALFFRRHLIISYFQGGIVTPRHYLIGMLTLWLTLEIGMILPIIGCYVTASYMPGLIPAVVVLVVYMTQWPSGKTMTSGAGECDDPELYEMPR
jgi:hypothetical protein